MSKGISEKALPAFEQATRLDGLRFGGTGLGMPITYNLIKLMGGTISVESEEGERALHHNRTALWSFARGIPSPSRFLPPMKV